MPKRRPIITCPKCHGNGTALLSPILVSTLAQVPSFRPVTASDLIGGAQGDIGITAINNRLEKLRELGFLMREKCGKFNHYRRARKEALRAGKEAKP